MNNNESNFYNIQLRLYIIVFVDQCVFNHCLIVSCSLVCMNEFNYNTFINKINCIDAFNFDHQMACTYIQEYTACSYRGT